MRTTLYGRPFYWSPYKITPVWWRRTVLQGCIIRLTISRSKSKSFNYISSCGRFAVVPLCMNGYSLRRLAPSFRRLCHKTRMPTREDRNSVLCLTLPTFNGRLNSMRMIFGICTLTSHPKRSINRNSPTVDNQLERSRLRGWMLPAHNEMDVALSRRYTTFRLFIKIYFFLL